jgi:hypothetical protein
MPQVLIHIKLVNNYNMLILGEIHMGTINGSTSGREFEETMKRYLRQGKEKLDNELIGTREAIKLIAVEKTKIFMGTMDKGLDEEERNYLTSLIVSSMFQSFCFGFGIGKHEGTTKSSIYF